MKRGRFVEDGRIQVVLSEQDVEFLRKSLVYWLMYNKNSIDTFRFTKSYILRLEDKLIELSERFAERNKSSHPKRMES